jgi:hypothetical protein
MDTTIRRTNLSLCGRLSSAFFARNSRCEANGLLVMCLVVAWNYFMLHDALDTLSLCCNDFLVQLSSVVLQSSTLPTPRKWNFTTKLARLHVNIMNDRNVTFIS